MPLLKKTTILFDVAHNEMLNIEEDDFSEFTDLLIKLGFNIIKNNEELTKKDLKDTDVLVIGNPISSYFSNIEIKLVVDYVREGGSLLILSEYGADFLQKTNLNDLTGTYFGIFFEKNIIKDENGINPNCKSILSIRNFIDHKITNQVREVLVGGTCSFVLNRFAKPLLTIDGKKYWSEEYNSTTEQWIKEQTISNELHYIISAYREYGRGKIVALGDIDILTNDPNIGINQQDNRKFIMNIFSWLTEPVKESSVKFWALDQLGSIQNEIKDINRKINNLIETMTFLERRISILEQKNTIYEEREDITKMSLKEDL